MHWPAIALFLLVACKKKEQEPAPAPAPTTPSVGHSSTKVKDDPGGEVAHAGGSREAPASDGEPADAQLYGGNGKPAYRDEHGRVHGPGGPIYMGKGPECTDKINHCLRDGVWFSVGNVQRGKLFRATPVFKFEDAWWSFREDKVDDHYAVYMTKVVDSPSELKPGSPVIWLVAENSSDKWLTSEHDALTSSRWEAGIIESVSGDTFKVAGWPNAVPTDTARVITQETK